ncbi:Hypothetical predicted protein [Cloeon dipterum]|uniref:Uncharacterized protein n=1 Tax=Cloeon dipterum TaxID=197152 RepID=A0A8S1CEB7_9INSE|nr:Hypothetical predicted protein [Cloeon dipterum]
MNHPFFVILVLFQIISTYDEAPANDILAEIKGRINQRATISRCGCINLLFLCS